MSIIKSPTLILGVAPPHKIDQSIRFNDDDSAYLHKTWSGAGDKQKFTFSFWVKRANITSRQILLSFRQDVPLEFEADDTLRVFLFGTTTLNTNRVFRDQSAFYHILLSVDSTNILSSDRVRLYVNGVRETSFSTESYPSLNASANIYTTTLENFIGRIVNGSNYFDGYMAEIAFIDGTSLEPSSFGLVNSSGIWIPRDLSDISFGSNGYHLKGESASDLGNDSSGNNNDFTTSGLASHDQVLDSPTNNWCVMNPLADYYANHTFRNGNLELLTSTTTNQYTYSINNIGMSSGKWYAEAYIDNTNAGQILIGISDRESQGGTHYLGSQSYEYSYYSNNGKSINGGTQSTYGNTFTTDDIIGIALDLDNSKLYFSKNGTFQNSGVPTSGSTGTGAVSITAVGSTRNGHYFFAVGDYSNAGNITVYWNFGQEGTFAGNTTAGGNSDSNGVGNFKYSVPSGYLALCTKNLGS
tara:strand:- start:832 stop:2238 length:1407 start_codon:yes stop_codon:yes gene_type:complete